MQFHDVRAILRGFDVPGQFLWAVPYGNGHINDTYLTAVAQAGREKRYILQHINGRVFKDPVGIVRNIALVTRHIEGKLIASGMPDVDRRVLRLLNTVDKSQYIRTADGEVWRGYGYVEGSLSLEAVERPEQAYEAARAFGEFQMHLADLDSSLVSESIPHFHDTPWRLQQLRDAVAVDRVGRVAQVRAEIDEFLGHEVLCGTLARAHQAGEIPLRVTHNDCKLNNVLFDTATDRAMCVIDLDTVMPGLSLHDFGDIVRTATSSVREDAAGDVVVSLVMFEQLLKGYLKPIGSILTEAEWENLPLCGPIITLEIGMRFLTDYLDGDRYFKTSYPEHNLVRARNQLARVRSMLRQLDGMKRLVERCHVGR